VRSCDKSLELPNWRKLQPASKLVLNGRLGQTYLLTSIILGCARLARTRDNDDWSGILGDSYLTRILQEQEEKMPPPIKFRFLKGVFRARRRILRSQGSTHL